MCEIKRLRFLSCCNCEKWVSIKNAAFCESKAPGTRCQPFYCLFIGNKVEEVKDRSCKDCWFARLTPEEQHKVNMEHEGIVSQALARKALEGNWAISEEDVASERDRVCLAMGVRTVRRVGVSEAGRVMYGRKRPQRRSTGITRNSTRANLGRTLAGSAAHATRLRGSPSIATSRCVPNRERGLQTAGIEKEMVSAVQYPLGGHGFGMESMSANNFSARSYVPAQNSHLGTQYPLPVTEAALLSANPLAPGVASAQANNALGCDAQGTGRNLLGGIPFMGLPPLALRSTGSFLEFQRRVATVSPNPGNIPFQTSEGINVGQWDYSGHWHPYPNQIQGGATSPDN